LNGKQELEGYFVYIKGVRIPCLESDDLVNDHMKCTIPLRTLFNFADFELGDLVQAQIADVHDGNVESELSELGGTAVIPNRDYFIKNAKSWECEFYQITGATVNDANPVHAMTLM